MRVLLLPVSGLLLLAVGCGETPASRPVAGGAPVLAGRFRHVKGNFYRDKAGQLFEQRESTEGEDAAPESWYDSTVVVGQASGPAAVPLVAVIDLSSYQDLDGSQFSKDRNHVYYSYSNSGGGFRTVVSGADPATFRPSPDYQYGFDAQHGYYCDRPLPGLRVRRRQLLYGDTVAHFVAYVKDDRQVFCQSEPVPGADARTFHLVRGKEWDAEDQRHRYQGGQQLR